MAVPLLEAQRHGPSLNPVQLGLVSSQYCSIHASISADVSRVVPGSRGTDQALTLMPRAELGGDEDLLTRAHPVVGVPRQGPVMFRGPHDPVGRITDAEAIAV